MNTKLPEPYASSYSPDKRKRRRQHRANARNLRRQNNGVFGVSGSIEMVARWHLAMARSL